MTTATKQKVSAVQDLHNYVQSLDTPAKGVVRINITKGDARAGVFLAAVTVDFGYTYPLARLNSEQNQTLTTKIRKAISEIVDNPKVSISVDTSSYHGLIYYANTYHNSGRNKRKD